MEGSEPPRKLTPEEIGLSLTAYLAKHPNPPHSSALWGWFFDTFPDRLEAYAKTQDAIKAKWTAKEEERAKGGPGENFSLETEDGAPTAEEREKGQGLGEG